MILLLGGAASWPLAGYAQQRPDPSANAYYIGYLRHVPRELDPFREAFLAGLRDFGYVEGRGVVILERHTSGRQELLERYAAELARRPVHVIVTGGTPAVSAAARATRTVPIVMAAIADPIKIGVIASLAHPGGNVTGMSILSADLTGKRLELLRDAVPRLATAGLLYHPNNASHVPAFVEAEAAAQELRLVVKRFPAIPREGFDHAFAAMAREQVDAILILDDGEFVAHRRTIIALAMDRGLPAAAGLTGFEEAGALLTYATDLAANYRRTGYFVDRILRGAKPGDLPVEQFSKIELAINLKTAKALGLTIPPSLLARADRVIE